MDLRTDDAKPLGDALAAMEALLARRVSALMAEVARYPTPIARCDEQLTRLIEQRTDAVGRLRAVRDLAAAAPDTPQRDWVARVIRWLEDCAPPEDADEAASIARLRSAASAAAAAAP